MKTIHPKGTLMPIGGGEDKENHKDILCRLIKETGRKNPRICIITVATSLPKDTAKVYRSAFKALGITDLTFIHFELHKHADKPKWLNEIKKCHAVLFSGGDQLKLTSTLGGTELLKVIKERYYDEPKFVIAGTSAGAAAMSNTMIISGSSKDALIKGELELTNGLDLISDVSIDTHFTERGRFGRLIQTVTCNPGVMGLGLGEDTAVVIHKGEDMEVVGSGLVTIVDGGAIVYTDLAEVSNGTPITVEGVRVNILGPGKCFVISERKIVNDGKAKKEKNKPVK